MAFRIVVLTPRARRLRCKDELRLIISQAMNEGLGAKTALGYGRFKTNDRES